MSNSSTAFILPGWLLLQEPGMQCRPHTIIIVMLAMYNLISVILSVILARPFFVRRKQVMARRLLHFWYAQILRRDLPRPAARLEYHKTTNLSYSLSVLGTILISLASPQQAGNSVTKGHPEANYWVFVQQWATRPRATVFVFLANGVLAVRHKGFLGSSFTGTVGDGHLDTAIVAIISDSFVGLLGLKFLLDQTSVSMDSFQSATPCTSLGSGVGTPNGPVATSASNCPDMQTGANGLVIASFLQVALTVASLVAFCVKGGNLKAPLLATVCAFLIPFFVFLYSWEIWANFLNTAPEQLYCVQANTPLDVIYILLPVFLGLWRLLCSQRLAL